MTGGRTRGCRPEGGVDLPGNREVPGPGVTGNQGWAMAREAGKSGIAGSRVRSKLSKAELGHRQTREWEMGRSQGLSQGVGVPPRYTCMHNWCVRQR